MTKAKKALSLILAVVMLFSVACFSAFAKTPAGPENTADIELAFDKTSYTAQDNIVVSVKLKANYFVYATSIPIEYDTAKVDGTDVLISEANLFGSAETTAAQVADHNGYALLALTPYSQGAAKPVATKPNNAVVCKITLKAIDAIADPAAVIGVKDDLRTAETGANSDGMLFVSMVDSAKIDVAGFPVYDYGMTVNFPKMGGAAVADPVLTGVSGGAVDTTHGANYVYGVPIGAANPLDYFAVENGAGTIEMVANANGVTNGTGATLVVKKSDGSEFARYTLIIFGDVTGDSLLNGSDVLAVKKAAANLSPFTNTNFAFAADVTGDGLLNGSDVLAIKKAAANLGSLSTNPYQK